VPAAVLRRRAGDRADQPLSAEWNWNLEWLTGCDRDGRTNGGGRPASRKARWLPPRRAARQRTQRVLRDAARRRLEPIRDNAVPTPPTLLAKRAARPIAAPLPLFPS